MKNNSTSKKFERVYLVFAIILVLVFGVSLFWSNLKRIFRPKTIDFISSSDNLSVYTKDSIYMNTILFSDIVGLYKINTSTGDTKELELDNAYNIFKSGNNIYYLSQKTLYRLDEITKKKEKLLDYGIESFKLCGETIIYKDELNRLYKYDIKNKKSEYIISAPNLYVVDNKLYMYYTTKQIVERDLETDQIKTYNLNFPIRLLSYYKGYFYVINEEKSQIVKLDREFKVIKELLTDPNLIEFLIIDERIFTLDFEKPDVCTLYSYDLDGNDKRLEKDNVYMKIFDKFIIEIKGNNQYSLYDLKKKQNIDLKGLKERIYTKFEIKNSRNINGFQMTKVNDVYYYRSHDELFSYDLKSDKVNKSIAKGVEFINGFYGNVFYNKNGLLYFYDGSEKIFANLNISDIDVEGKNMLLRTSRGIYLYNIETGQLKKIDDSIIFAELEDDKIYYIKFNSYVVLYEYDIKLNKLNEYRLNVKNLMIDSFRIYKGNMIYFEYDKLYRYDIKSNKKFLVASLTDVVPAYVENDKLYLYTIGGLNTKIYELSLSNFKLKDLCTINKADMKGIEGFIYDRDINKLVVKYFGEDKLSFIDIKE
ncbi:DUF5050 domain-containing protein [Thermobrachium celere]|uniref:Prolow-density lipoprotein receptor-related protein 1-like beta-propeller domain-containing protein n=1 Tax=Thermobrachium celere DSM 8682 TaxID=941824 RepID=R7RQE8_9CLOT|nr:DUF5050 domain-containing protein [Thermobrachium celere]CDF57546.1 hypothetical protein TCEL_01460 [Thermobrachium celere DSM 8682]